MTHFFQRAGAGLLVSCTLASLPAAEPQPAPKRVRPVLTQTLPHLQGDRLQATMLEVNYGPGESSTAHSHPCAVLGYVVQGAIRTQVKGELEAIFKAGEGFYEAPNGVHAISANASKTEPAKFVAYFVCDHKAPLSIDVPQAQTSPARHTPALRTATGKERATATDPSSQNPSPAPEPEPPTTNPDCQGGVSTALRTATGKESPMALRAAKVQEAAHPAPVPERQRRATGASSTERATGTHQSLPDQKSISSPTHSRSVSDGLPLTTATDVPKPPQSTKAPEPAHPTQSRSVSDGLASATSTWSTPTLRNAEAPQ